MRRILVPALRHRLYNRLAKDAKGSVTLLFALCSVILLAMLGLAVDYGRATKAKARLAAAADAAALAAVRAATDIANANPDLSSTQVAAQAEELARSFMASNAGHKVDATVSPVEVHVELSNGAWSSTLGFAASVDTTVSAALGIQTINVGGTSKSSIRPAFPVLDIAMCVDSTGSMTPTLDAVKANASNFFDNLNAELNRRNLPSFPLVRVRMVYFKDFGDRMPGIWDAEPIRASDFMQLPSQTSAFTAFVSPQRAGGGWDTPESGVECLNEAMNSQWMKVGQVPSGFSMPVTDVYPLIVIWTDAPSHPVPFPNSLANPAYPPESSMPRTSDALLAKWNNGSVIDQAHKQILFFGNPDITSFDQGAHESGWQAVKTWPGFTVGGSLTAANTSMIEFLASGIANKAKQLRITQ